MSFKVLSLSGGGMRGVFAAAVLCELQAALRNRTGNPNTRLIDHVDLIVGTSTGGLIGLGLVFDQSPDQLLAVYKEHGARIFPPWWKWWFAPRALAWPLFGQQALRDVVAACVPHGAKLGEAKKPIVLTAVRRDTGEITCLKSRRDDKHYIDHEMCAVSAGLATAAAPLAFRHATTDRRGDLIDGGLWANTPILVGLIEAHKYHGHDLKDVRVLSIGTTSSKFPVRRPWQRGGITEFGMPLGGRLLDLVWNGQQCLARQAAELMLPYHGLLHIDHEFAGRGIKMMDASPTALHQLEQAGRTAAQKAAAAACDMLCAT